MNLFSWMETLFVGRSSITRASSFFEIPDLSKNEAMIYLMEKRNLSKDHAEELYALFGGRIKSLQNAASKLESGVDFASKSFSFSVESLISLIC